MNRRDIGQVALVAIAMSSVAVAAQEGWPKNIESLLFQYLSALQEMKFTSLSVHCTPTVCEAVFTTVDGTPASPTSQQVVDLHAKGWNVVSAGTGSSFDPATREHKSTLTIANDLVSSLRPL
jgi:hypothetical protein